MQQGARAGSLGPSPHGARTLAAEGQNTIFVHNLLGVFPARSAGKKSGVFPARSRGDFQGYSRRAAPRQFAEFAKKCKLVSK